MVLLPNTLAHLTVELVFFRCLSRFLFQVRFIITNGLFPPSLWGETLCQSEFNYNGGPNNCGFWLFHKHINSSATPPSWESCCVDLWNQVVRAFFANRNTFPSLLHHNKLHTSSRGFPGIAEPTSLHTMSGDTFIDEELSDSSCSSFGERAVVLVECA